MSERELGARELKTLKAMDAIQGHAVVREILKLWDHDYGRAVWRGGWLRLATGGWSENEAIVSHLPRFFWTFYWHHSASGGLFVFKVPKREGSRCRGRTPETGKRWRRRGLNWRTTATGLNWWAPGLGMCCGF